MAVGVRFVVRGIALALAFVLQAQAASPDVRQFVAADDDKSPLTASRMFQVLAADIAIQRGEFEVAAKIYLELATTLKDARLARRAAQAAGAARAPALVLEAAKTWAGLDPDSAQARNTLAAVLVSQGPLSESRGFLSRWIADAPDKGEVLRNLNRVLASQKDKREVFAVVKDVAAPYDLFEAHLAVAQAALAVDPKDKAVQKDALAAVDRALALQPGADPAGEVKAELLLRDDPQAAVAFLTGFGSQFPSARESRYMLARLLLTQGKSAAARDALAALVARFPEDGSMRYMLALAQYEAKDLPAAEKTLNKLLDDEAADQDRVLTLLGQVMEDQKRYPEALNHYRAIGEGDLWFGAQQRIGLVLGRMGSIAEARAHLKAVRATPSQKILLALTEGNVLREANLFKEAFDHLTGAAATWPESTDVLYDLAMSAEKVDRLDVLEKSLRKVIALKPDDSQSLNALGYSLVDRTSRVDEGMKLIEKALSLSPDDGYILDSMGWGYYRMGQYPKSLEYLRKALDKRPDPEVAAHLGEVLWKTGDKDGAQKVWRDALADSPEHPVLTETMKRLGK